MITEIIKGKEIRGEIPYYCIWKSKTGCYNLTIKLYLDDTFSMHSICECKWFCFYGQSKRNKGKEICRHLIIAYAKILKISPKEARKNLIKQGIMNNNHLINLK